NSYPRPEGGRIPIVIGGHAEAAVARAGRMADGWFPFAIDPATFERRAETLRDAARAAGRDTTEIEISARPGSPPGAYGSAVANDLGVVRRYVAAGAGRLVLQPRLGPNADLRPLAEQIQRYRENVLAML